MIVYDQSSLLFGLVGDGKKEGVNGYIWNFK